MGWGLLLAAVAAAGNAGATPPPKVEGVYRMQAAVRLDPGALPVQEVEARGDAVLEPGATPGLLRARLAARGQRCVLEARVAEGGALAFPPGQRCRIVLDDEEAQGTVDATLASGTGRAVEGRLALDLTFRLAGAVRLRPASLELLGSALGGARLPEVPVSGEARARGEGRRDESRAAGR